jgi:hypothetical protein
MLQQSKTCNFTDFSHGRESEGCKMMKKLQPYEIGLK